MTPLNEDSSRAASDIRISALFTAPTIARRRDAAVAMHDPDWRRLADREYRNEYGAVTRDVDEADGWSDAALEVDCREHASAG